MKKSFGQLLKQLRYEKNIKAVEVANNISVSRAYIAAIEADVQPAPSFDHCCKISQLLTLNSEEAYLFFTLALQSRLNEDLKSFISHLDTISPEKNNRSYLNVQG